MNPSHCLTVFSGLLLTIALSHTPLTAELPPNWPANYPAWWYNSADPASGVIDATVSTLNQNNNASIKQGQLWNLAAQAIDELNESLALLGGAGFTLEDFRDPTQSPDYQATVKIGQLKNISAKFFDRFAAIGFQPGDAGWPTGLNLNPITSYPWPENQSPSNLELANLGQAKHLFSWDVLTWITKAMENDSDGDGLPDFWENFHFGNLKAGSDDDPDSDGVSNLMEYKQGTEPK